MIGRKFSSKHRINVICAPISQEILKVDKVLKDLLIDMEYTTGKKYNYFSKNHFSKRIRQAMILLPVKSLNAKDNKVLDEDIIAFAASVEIVFNSIKFHDDINEDKVDNERSVLSGDLLQSIALQVGLKLFPKNLLLELTNLIEKSCYRRISEELEKNGDKYTDEESYIKSVKIKTGELMGIFVKLGAYLSGTDKNDAEAIMLESCGFNIGMALHIMEDRINSRNEKCGFNGARLIKGFAQDAAKSINSLKESPYKSNLIKLIDYFIDFSQNEITGADIY